LLSGDNNSIIRLNGASYSYRSLIGNCSSYRRCRAISACAAVIDSNGVDLTGLLGDIKKDWGSGGRKSPIGVRGGAPVGGLGDEVQKLKLFL